MSSRASRERARQMRRRVAMAQRLGAIVLVLVMVVALMSIFRGCGKVDDPTLPPVATESSTEAISTEDLSASSMSYSPEPAETSTYYGDPDNYVYPFNTMSTDWDGSVYDNGFKLYEIPEEYAREGGCFPEVVQVYLWCLCEQRDIDYYMVVALIERESGYKWVLIVCLWLTTWERAELGAFGKRVSTVQSTVERCLKGLMKSGRS